MRVYFFKGLVCHTLFRSQRPPSARGRQGAPLQKLGTGNSLGTPSGIPESALRSAGHLLLCRFANNREAHCTLLSLVLRERIRSWQQATSQTPHGKHRNEQLGHGDPLFRPVCNACCGQFPLRTALRTTLWHLALALTHAFVLRHQTPLVPWRDVSLRLSAAA